MKKISLVISLFSVIAFSSSAMAAGYGAAGCGLGSIVFGDEPGLVQVVAATTNGTSYSQTLGITSGTSNCDDTGIVLAEKEKEMFVEHNLENIKKEMAAGQGEHLNTLAGLMGCPIEKRAQFASLTQENYETIIAAGSATSTGILMAVQNNVKADPELSRSCLSLN